MNFKLSVASITLLSFFLASSFSMEYQTPEWKGNIEQKNGVKVVVNPKAPLFGEVEFELIQDLRIGNPDDENFLFFQATRIAVDKDGCIYVVDSGNHRVQKFDDKGEYLLSIGNRGQGPGEFSRPFKVRIDNQSGNIYVFDVSRKILIFDHAGKHLGEDIYLYDPLNDFYIDADKNIIATYSAARFQGMIKYIKGEREGKKIEEYHRQINVQTTSSRREGTRVFSTVFGGTHGYEFSAFLAQLGGDEYVLGHSKNYELSIINRKGKDLFFIRKNITAINFTNKIKERISYQAKMSALTKGVTPPAEYEYAFPEHLPFFYEILTDSEGRIYVQINREEFDPTKLKPYDIFSRDGYYLYKAVIDVSPHVIKDGFLYTLSSDKDTGDQIILRYKIINWDQIKTGIN